MLVFNSIVLVLLGSVYYSSALEGSQRACTNNNNFAGKTVRATGDWAIELGSASNWNAAEPLGRMEFDEATCSYIKVLNGLTPNKDYLWKVAINDAWGENYGANGQAGGANAVAKTSPQGGVRLMFKPQGSLTSDFNVNDCANGPCVIPTTASPATGGLTDASGSSSSTTTQATTLPANCPTNAFTGKVVRASGDWSLDVAGTPIWNGAEPSGLMGLDATCNYVKIVKGMKPNTSYKWKVTIDNTWAVNYGCSGANGPDCGFKSSSGGAVRFVMKPTSPPQLTTDYNVAPCGDGICEEGESCSYCPQDCGECPPPVCGDGVCDEGQNFQTCPEDCPNQLPGCGIFNDEGCKSGSQITANPGVENRRWQTPKPGTKGWLPGFQHYYALVGYADIRYTSSARTEADVCIVATHKDSGSVTLTYIFNGAPQSSNCKKFTSSHKDTVALKVTGSDGTELDIPAISLIWNAQPLKQRGGDYRNGQKGAVPEMFGWTHKDVMEECELMAKAGYLGVKLFPIHEQVMSTQPFENAMNPWYFMYQPISYKLDGRSGTREELEELVKVCRGHGLRVYADIILNHFSGAGNDLHDHRNPNAGCTPWGNKTSSAPLERQSPYYTHSYTYKYNVNTGAIPSNEFPGAGLGPDDFHCDRILGSWSDLFILNNGWLVGLTDIHTGKDNVRERQAAYIVEMMSLGISGFRIDAAKHISPEDLTAILKKIQVKMGGQLPDDFFTWLEVITGGEAGVIWFGPSWYGSSFESMLLKELGSQSEVDKIKMWDGLYPKEPQNTLVSKKRVVIQNDDHDQQMPGSSSRDMGPFGCVLVKDCREDDHRNFEIRLFENPNGVSNNADDWPIRFILSSYYHTHGKLGIPDGKSMCKDCTVTCQTCREDIPYIKASVPGECAYKGSGYTKTHRDIRVINAMRKWIGLGPISGGDVGLPGCN